MAPSGSSSGTLTRKSGLQILPLQPKPIKAIRDTEVFGCPLLFAILGNMEAGFMSRKLSCVKRGGPALCPKGKIPRTSNQEPAAQTTVTRARIRPRGTMAVGRKRQRLRTWTLPPRTSHSQAKMQVRTVQHLRCEKSGAAASGIPYSTPILRARTMSSIG